ncbi:signal peptidase [Chryseobacterium oryzae]|uniref:Signal peptidase n=1 Tax=Chryseobacterium oryzae TaxID=2929799 RepID=A0ABY4BHR6_9FLAO|nr:signal peptidase [Chryseobacterium oryzae]UOE38721.1 signal peptidase [Chryseobacterium oryzae]
MKKIFVLLFINCFLLVFSGPPCPTCTTPGKGGVGGVTPGSAATPIDMYVYVLAIVAFLIIAFVAKKYKTQKI